ncbi:MAG: GGDEF domain-containing protein, partial [Betaproteobacteria bacterium]|nr:GGDEF domain-containing protein [Betaproteobacteria bacterium]
MRWLRSQAASLLPFLALLWMALPQSAQAQVRLDARAGSIDLWPSVSILRNAAPGLDATAAALAARDAFTAPQSAHATLGFAEPFIWMRIPVVNPAAAPATRVLTFDYALLHFVDVTLAAGGTLQTLPRVGNKVARAERPIAGRNHALEIVFPPGASELLIRVESPGSKILPMFLSTWPAYHRGELIETMVQGLLASLALWLLFYSLLQWRVLQEALYLKYGLLIVASALFSIHFFGIGEQYLWGDHHWIENHLAGLSALMASCATALFVEDALRADSPPVLSKALLALAGLMALCALAHALDWIGIREVGVVMGSLGLLPVVLGTPGAVRRLKRGDAVGGWFLLAWTGYLIGSAVMVGVVKGSVGANFWTLHSFQAAATIDMLIFMQIAVIGTRRIKEELAAERRQF